jgi:hypothetical protein
VTIQVLLNDLGGTLATVTAVGTPTNGTVTTNGTTITYTPNPDCRHVFVYGHQWVPDRHGCGERHG